MTRTLAVTLALGALLSGCGPSQARLARRQVEQQTLYREGWKKYGEPKAAFDLNCPAGQLEISELNEFASSVGVRGCGRQARYEWAESVGWVMDATSRSDPSNDSATPTDSAPRG